MKIHGFLGGVESGWRNVGRWGSITWCSGYIGVQCAVCSVQCAVCSVQCAVCSVQCAVCSGAMCSAGMCSTQYTVCTSYGAVWSGLKLNWMTSTSCSLYISSATSSWQTDQPTYLEDFPHGFMASWPKSMLLTKVHQTPCWPCPREVWTLIEGFSAQEFCIWKVHILGYISYRDLIVCLTCWTNTRHPFYPSNLDIFDTEPLANSNQ